MRLHGRGVDQNLSGRTASRGQGMENVDPHAFGSPSDKSIVQRLSRPVDVRGIDPATTGLEHMDDAADHPAVIDPRLAARVPRQQRLEPSELVLCQPEIVAIHLWSPFGDGESQNRCQRNPLYRDKDTPALISNPSL